MQRFWQRHTAAQRTRDFLAVLTKWIAKHNESLQQHQQLRSNSQEIEHLKLVIEKYRRMIFGRKSEKLTRELEQLELRLEELETTQAADEAAQDAAEAGQPSSTGSESKRRSSRPRRKPLPEDLPRESSPTCPSTTAVPIAVLGCGSSARMLPSNWSVFRQHTRSFATFAPSSHAPVVTASWRRLLLPGRLRTACLAPICLHMCWSRNFATTSLFTGSLRPLRGKASILIARHLPDGREPHINCLHRWSRRSGGMLWRGRRYTPTTPRFLYSHPATERPRRGASGLTSAMIGRPRNPLRLLSGLPIRKTVEENILSSI
jgi:hypothetical protein